MTSSPQPRRSDATRAAILDAARERFASDGYERATIRGIAADAGIDPAMVMRYYGSKEKLFAAAAEFDLRLPDLVDTRTAGTDLVAHFLDRWEDDEVLTALLRAAVTNPAASERMQGIFASQVATALARLTPDAGHAATRVGLAASQILGLALTRYVLKFPPVVGMSRAEIIGWLGPTVQRYLTSTPESAPPSPSAGGPAVP